MAKNRGFLKIFGRKIFFSKKVLFPLLELFIAVLLSYHTHVYLKHSLRYSQMSKLVPRSSGSILSSWVWSDQTTRTGIGARVWSGLSVLRDDWSYDSHFSKKRLCPQRRTIMGKNFRNHDFRFKISFRSF